MGTNHGSHYKAIKQEQRRLGRILDAGHDKAAEPGE